MYFSSNFSTTKTSSGLENGCQHVMVISKPLKICIVKLAQIGGKVFGKVHSKVLWLKYMYCNCSLEVMASNQTKHLSDLL